MPLPNSIKAGQGLTRIPFKCHINSDLHLNQFTATCKKKRSLEKKEYTDLTEISEHLKQLNQNDLEEIQVDFPLTAYNAHLASIDWIDCIGLPDSSYPNAKELIYKSLGDGVDAVFFYCRESLQQDQLSAMYESGIFSFSASQPPPKIVQIYFAQEQEISLEKDFDIDFRNTKIKKTLEDTLENGFDKIKIDHVRKEKLLPDLRDRCDCLCLHKQGNSFEPASISKLNEILGEMKKHKIAFTEKIAIEKMCDICDDLIARFDATQRRSKKDSSIYNAIADYFYVQKTYKKLIDKSLINIEALFDDHIEQLAELDQSEIYCEHVDDEESNSKTNMNVIFQDHFNRTVIRQMEFFIFFIHGDYTV